MAPNVCADQKDRDENKKRNPHFLLVEEQNTSAKVWSSAPPMSAPIWIFHDKTAPTCERQVVELWTDLLQGG